MGDAPISEVGRRLGFVYLVVDQQLTTGEPAQATNDIGELVRRRVSGYEARGGDGPGIDHGIDGPFRVELNGHHRVERQPGAVYPKFVAGLSVANRIADQSKGEHLRNALNRKLVIGVTLGRHPARDRGDADPEQLVGRLGEGRNVIGDHALVEMAVPLVALANDQANGLFTREVPGRNERLSFG